MPVRSAEGAPSAAPRSARRLIFLVLWLALIDQFVLAVQGRMERDRYERGPVIRFENSDLFGLGPLVSYLRENPRGDRPRAVFFGNSVVWGYSLRADWTIPAYFQDLQSDARAFNLAVNGFQMGNAYLVAKAIIGSVDRIYVQHLGDTAHPQLAAMVPVDPDDQRRFNLQAPDPIERRLQAALSPWQLYASSYRLQAAVLGTSTRQYLYLHKGDIVRSLLSRQPVTPAGPPPSDDHGTIEIVAPRSEPTPERRVDLARRHSLLWRFGELATTHRKRVVFLHFDERDPAITNEEIAGFNGAFAPFAEVIRLNVASELKFDGQHLTPAGSRAVAGALVRHQRVELNGDR